jgi:hypothetical protein
MWQVFVLLCILQFTYCLHPILTSPDKIHHAVHVIFACAGAETVVGRDPSECDLLRISGLCRKD